MRTLSGTRLCTGYASTCIERAQSWYKQYGSELLYSFASVSRREDHCLRHQIKLPAECDSSNAFVRGWWELRLGVSSNNRCRQPDMVLRDDDPAYCPPCRPFRATDSLPLILRVTIFSSSVPGHRTVICLMQLTDL
jgi:hypothetical protein